MNWRVPALGAIQRTSAQLTVVFAFLLLAADSRAAAIGCLVGGALMIANLFVLTVVGRAIIALAQGGGAGKAGVILAPLKMFIFVGLVYLLMTTTRLDPAGFLAGALTQFIAIFIETWRASTRGAFVRPEDQQV